MAGHWVWMCSFCRQGPWNAAIDVLCPYCGRQRDKNSLLQWIKEPEPLSIDPETLSVQPEPASSFRVQSAAPTGHESTEIEAVGASRDAFREAQDDSVRLQATSPDETPENSYKEWEVFVPGNVNEGHGNNKGQVQSQQQIQEEDTFETEAQDQTWGEPGDEERRWVRLKLPLRSRHGRAPFIIEFLKSLPNLDEFLQEIFVGIGIMDPSPPPDHIRFHWRCRCSYEGFEDIHISQAATTRRYLEQAISNGEINAVAEHNSSSMAGNALRLSLRATWRTIRNCWIVISGKRRDRSPNRGLLPLYNRRTPWSKHTVAPMYLLQCMIKKQKFNIPKMSQFDVSTLETDRQLFMEIKQNYLLFNKRSLWSLRQPIGIWFVRFRLQEEDDVDEIVLDELPPLSRCGDSGEYACHRLPVEGTNWPLRNEVNEMAFGAPVAPNVLRHWIFDPTEAGEHDELFTWHLMPKKRYSKLVMPLSIDEYTSYVVGWGIYIGEGFKWPKAMLYLVILLLSGVLLFAALYGHFQQDLPVALATTTVFCTVPPASLVAWQAWTTWHTQTEGSFGTSSSTGFYAAR